MTLDLATATHESFAPYVSTTFTVVTEAGPVVLTLDNVKLGSEGTLRDSHVEIDGVALPARRAFALTFEGPAEPVLTQRMYPVTHPDCGEMQLFLSPFRQDQSCMLYESVFS